MCRCLTITHAQLIDTIKLFMASISEVMVGWCSWVFLCFTSAFIGGGAELEDGVPLFLKIISTCPFKCFLRCPKDGTFGTRLSILLIQSKFKKKCYLIFLNSFVNRTILPTKFLKIFTLNQFSTHLLRHWGKDIGEHLLYHPAPLTK